MTKAALKAELKKAIGKVQDEHVLEAIYSVLYSHLHPEEVELTEEDKADLDRRLARDNAGLEKGSSWETVKARIRKKRKAA
jgi:putative addiction module component (TIGR02574 family)